MKKLLAFALVGGLFSLSACTEKGPAIDFGGGAPKVDTTYDTTVETAQQRNVMIEEFTGVSCANCPSGHHVIATIEGANPGRIVAAGLYETGPVTTDPIEGLTRQDLRTAVATTIANSVYGGIVNLPTAGIDRMPISGSYQIDRSLWGSTVTARLSVTPPVNLNITSSYNPSDSTASITIKVAFTQSVTHDLNITAGITEDSIIEAQEDGINIDTIYVQNHVLRDVITQPTGDNFLHDLTTKEAGRVYIRRYSYKIPSGALWVIPHCKVYAFVHVTGDPSSKEILQAAETTLDGH